MAKRILATTKQNRMDADKAYMGADIKVVGGTQQALEGSYPPSSMGKENYCHMADNDELLMDPAKDNSFAGTRHPSTDSSKIIRHYLKTIQTLETTLAKKEQELGEKNETLKEVKEDLARDEKIFTEKMREIRTLKLLARELSKEKDCLLQKVQMDASIISNLSRNALAKEGELSRLRASIDSQHVESEENVELKRNRQFSKVLESAQDQYAWEDSVSCNEERGKEDFVEMSRPLEEKTNQRTQSFEKRFQDLAYNILRGGKMRLGRDGMVEAVQLDERFTDAMAEAKPEALFDDAGHLGNKSCEWTMGPYTAPVHDQIPLMNQGCDIVARVEDATSDMHLGMELGDSSPGHNHANIKSRSCMETITSTIHCPEPKSMYLEKKLREIALAWNAEKQAMEEMVQAERETWEARAVCAMRKQEQLERDHQALKEELENTRSLMQKAGLGIRLSAHNVRELSNGDVDVRTSITC